MVVAKILIVTSTGIPEERVKQLQGEYQSRAEFIAAEDKQVAIFSKVTGVDALIGCPRYIFSQELLDKAGESLRWIHVDGAGCEEFFIPGLVKSHIVLTNGKIIQGPEVADHAFALLLSLTRNIAYVLRKQTAPMSRPIELRRKVAVIIGCGGIGMLIAERAAAFGMKVFGVTPDYVPMLKMYDGWFPPHHLKEALALADVVFMAAPVTEETKQMMGQEEFAAMKDTAYFINVSRGRTVDTEALTKILQQGKLKGVGFDVSDPEPLPEEHPLRDMVNVVITPHIAGPSDKNRGRSFELIKNNIERFINHGPLINVVDKELGY